MKNSFLEKYPDEKFYEVIYPGSKTGDQIELALDNAKIPYLDYKYLF